MTQQGRAPVVVRAAVSPSALLLAAAGVAVGLLTGGGVAGALVLGVVAWAGRVGYAVARRPKPERIEPLILGEPWRQLVLRAQSIGNRFDEAVRRCTPGPLKDRLADVNGQVHAAIREGWAIAKRGDVLDDAVSTLDIPGLERRRSAATDPAVRQSLENQLSSAQRIAGVSDTAKTRLQRLNAELEESVARAVELSVSAPDTGALQPLGSSVDDIVTELESLRQALEETG